MQRLIKAALDGTAAIERELQATAHESAVSQILACSSPHDESLNVRSLLRSFDRFGRLRPKRVARDGFAFLALNCSCRADSRGRERQSARALRRLNLTHVVLRLMDDYYERRRASLDPICLCVQRSTWQLCSVEKQRFSIYKGYGRPTTHFY